MRVHGLKGSSRQLIFFLVHAMMAAPIGIWELAARLQTIVCDCLSATLGSDTTVDLLGPWLQSMDIALASVFRHGDEVTAKKSGGEENRVLN